MLNKFVDVFCGNGDARLPRPGSLCAKWFFPKAQAGNTVPHAARPFRMLTAGPYNGAYPIGYGLNKPNCNGNPPKFAQHPWASGFTHFHHSGTGGIGVYYNYFKVIPNVAGASCSQGRASNTSNTGAGCSHHIVKSEIASPGYYSAEFENGIRAELAVADMAALHRYSFPNENATLSVDFAQNGLDKSFGKNFYDEPEDVRVEKISPQRAEGFIQLFGQKIYASIWCPEATECVVTKTNAVFSLGANRNAQIKLGFSFHSTEKAREHLDAAPGFETAVQRAREEWEDALSAIRIETPDENLKRCFYSMLYHTLIKPARLDDPSPYDGSPSYYMDFTTMWDLYKTQLPLVIALYPDHAAGMVNSLLATGKKNGLISCAIILNNQADYIDYQARMLACYTVCSAYFQKIQGVDWREALEILWRDLQHPRNKLFLEQGTAERNTYILDLADGCHCLAQLAADLGDTAKHAELTRLAKHWRNAYDPQTGMLRADKEYYEGTFANYSFRLLHDMQGRIELCGGVQKFEEALDRFFGFGCEDAKQQLDPNDGETMARGFALGRFEGFNNEPDMETPYNYILAGRHDKLCEILTAGMSELFSADRDGIPGNNDSGGLSSCYIWNTLGIFPAFASRLYLLGRPFYERAELRLDQGKNLTILAHGLTPQTQYIRRIAFNGNELKNYWLSCGELLAGGTLEFWMYGGTP